MSLTESDELLECIRQNGKSPNQQISDNEPNETEILKSDKTTNSASSATNSGENPEEDYIRNYLKNYTWYHGMMFGNIVEKMLKWENSFLVRRIITKGKHKWLCISVRINQKIFHFSLNQNEEGWICPKLIEKYPNIPNRRYEHIYQIIDAWSAVFPTVIPVPRRSMVLQHNSILLENRLGNGAFGEVFQAKFTAIGASQPIEVAVKRVIGAAKRDQLQEFCHEASIMAVLHHENIVAFYGIASLEEPIMVVMEMVTGGDLKKYLQNTPNISKPQIIYFALNIACGMRHLASKNVIHRDLAARNCLITKELKVKISDFGLSIFGTDVIQKKLKKAPIRWLAPETLIKGMFNEKTDVWSYGVVLTELMTKCEHNPLYPLNINDASEWIKNAEWPHRISNGEPKELLEIVDMCCDRNPETRINFTTAKRRVQALYLQCLNVPPISPTATTPTTPTAITTATTLPTISTTAPLDAKKSEDRIRSFKINLSRKKSFDGTKSKTSTRKRGFLSFRRRNKQLTLPTGMTTNTVNQSSDPTPSTPSPSTPASAASSTTSSGPPTTRSPSTNP